MSDSLQYHQTYCFLWKTLVKCIMLDPNIASWDSIVRQFPNNIEYLLAFWGKKAPVWEVFFQIQFLSGGALSCFIMLYHALSTFIHLSLGKTGPFTLESHIHVKALRNDNFEWETQLYMAIFNSKLLVYQRVFRTNPGRVVRCISKNSRIAPSIIKHMASWKTLIKCIEYVPQRTNMN